MPMHSYSKMFSRYWTGTTGKALRGNSDAQVLGAYFMSSPHSEMTGVYYLAWPTLLHETGLSDEGASKALRRLSDLGYAYYDAASETVWVPGMLEHQVGESLKPKDRRAQGIHRLIEKYRKTPFFRPFVEKYNDSHRLGFTGDDLPEDVTPSKAPSPSEGASKPLPSPSEASSSSSNNSSSSNRSSNRKEMPASPESTLDQREPPASDVAWWWGIEKIQQELNGMDIMVLGQLQWLVDTCRKLAGRQVKTEHIIAFLLQKHNEPDIRFPTAAVRGIYSKEGRRRKAGGDDANLCELPQESWIEHVTSAWKEPPAPGGAPPRAFYEQEDSIKSVGELAQEVIDEAAQSAGKEGCSGQEEGGREGRGEEAEEVGQGVGEGEAQEAG